MDSKVIFKSVGQGDTIIIEQETLNSFLIGIIDCKLTYNKKNVVSDYLDSLIKTNKKIEIEFIALSHPHKDHYNGMVSLFDHLEKINETKEDSEKIKVKRLYHTYWFKEAFLNRNKNKLEAIYLPEDYEKSFKLFVDKLVELKILGLIVKKSEINEGSTSLLFGNENNDLIIRPFSPSDEEKDYFLDKMCNSKSDISFEKINEYSNHHSSILKIKKRSKNNFILLTSDAEKMSFERLCSDDEFWNCDHQIFIGQIPHHGSLNNYHKKFWEKSFQNNQNTTVILSVGNEKVKHPEITVIESLKEIGYKNIATTGKTSKKMGIDKMSHNLDYISGFNYNIEDDIIVSF